MKRTPLQSAALAVCVLIACGYLAGPFVWLFGASLASDKEYARGGLFPRRPTTEAYAGYAPWRPPQPIPDPDAPVVQAREIEKVMGIETAQAFPAAVGNSLAIAVSVTAVNLLLGSLAAYGLARIPSGLSFPLLLFFLVSRSVPAVALMIPMYLMIRNAGLLDHPLSVVLAHSTFTLPFTIWLLKGYFQTVPADLERAARVDGCSRMRALVRVFLPVTTPGLVAAGIFAFISSWGEFLYALLFTTRFARPLTVVLSDFISEVEIPYPMVAAGGVLAVALPVLLAFVFQRYLVRGIGGSVTG